MATKPNKIQQKLSTKQLIAVNLLLQGLTDQEVADRVRVRRETVNQWKNHNPYFQDELDRQRREVWGAIEDGLAYWAQKAVGVLGKKVEEGSLKAAIETLKATGVYGKIEKPSQAIEEGFWRTDVTDEQTKAIYKILLGDKAYDADEDRRKKAEAFKRGEIPMGPYSRTQSSSRPVTKAEKEKQI